jgi:hypothetical protein
MQNKSGVARVSLSISGLHKLRSASIGAALFKDSAIGYFRTLTSICHKASTITALVIFNLPRINSIFLRRSGVNIDIF